MAANYMLVGHGPWDNEKDRKLDIDWTPLWRGMDEIWASMMGTPDWKERGDKSRRYIGLGKAGREIYRWLIEPIKEFGNKLSPVASTTFEQLTGSDVGGSWEEPWARDDLDAWDETAERFKHVMGKFKPFSLSGNNAFLAFPSRKGMTKWKANKAYFDIYKAKAEIASGGVTGALTKTWRILATNDEKLMKEIAEAATANGVNPEKSRKAARAKALGVYYGRFWKAALAQDVAGAEKWAKALTALGMTNKGFAASKKSRKDSLTPEAIRVGEGAF